VLDPMKSVCLVTQSDYQVDPRVRRKAEALVADGYTVDVLALRAARGEKHYTLNGVNVCTVSLGKKRGSFARYVFEYAAFFLWAFVRVPLQMRKRRYAVIDVNTLPDFLIFAPAIARRMGAKLVLDMHEITPEFYRSKYAIAESSWMVRFVKRVEKRSIDFADHVITINEPIKKLLESRGLPASKCSVVMNSVDEALFASAPAGSAPAMVRRPRQFVMMYHGTLTAIYGLDIAIRAFGEANKRMPGAEFWILGNGPEKKSLEDLARKVGLQEKVKFLGNVLPQEVPQWLNCCDAGVLATRRDVFLDYSFSNKLSEYIITSKPVISSRLKTIRHYFSEDALAFFEPNNPSDLAKQMVRLYSNRDIRVKFSERARQEYAPINWDVMKERYLKLMDRATGAKAASSLQPATVIKPVSQS